ncbi:MAG: heliorhodopsin HeR, partial [Ilumatobacteraceae bacterium]
TVGRRGYLSELSRQQNRFRWVEYSLSSTLMIILIAMVFGISDIAALLGLAGANAAMILFGWIMEVVNRPGQPVWWSPFWFGCIAGGVPWVVLFIYVIGPSGQPEFPAFVWGILISLFIFFNLFALNQWLQYRGVGRWSDYLYGERVYLVLSLTAKSALAWQVFGNTLAG